MSTVAIGNLRVGSCPPVTPQHGPILFIQVINPRVVKILINSKAVAVDFAVVMIIMVWMVMMMMMMVVVWVWVRLINLVLGVVVMWVVVVVMVWMRLRVCLADPRAVNIVVFHRQRAALADLNAFVAHARSRTGYFRLRGWHVFFHTVVVEINPVPIGDTAV